MIRYFRSRIHKITWIVILAGFVILGLGIRLYDLTDPPLDFHPTRQLQMAIIARGIYYQMSPTLEARDRQIAISIGNSMGVYEPRLIETLLALTYRLMGGEHLWVARIYTSLFWLIGGLALFALAWRMTSAAGALVALAFYLFLPFSVFASRSLLPDPGMVMWIILAAYSFYRWAETQKWKWALLAGITSGMAVLVKVTAASLIAGMAVAGVLSVIGFKRCYKNPQVWAMAVLMIIPAGYYYLYRMENRVPGLVMNWTVALFHLFIDPSFYARWINLLGNVIGITVLFLGITGVLISKPLNRVVLIGLWIGYLIYGFIFPHQITTHSYYSLLLVPILALSLAPLGTLILGQLSQQHLVWRVLFACAILVVFIHQFWYSYSILAGQDYHDVPAYWQAIGKKLPAQGKIIAVTQEYGYYVEYYGWRKVSLWPSPANRIYAEQRGKRQKDFLKQFLSQTEGKDYFLITAFEQLNKEPLLKATLNDHYPVHSKGEGYLVYDLVHPLSPP